MNRSINLLDLINKDKLNEILNGFTEATGIASIIAELDGRPITKPHNFTSLCKNYCRSTEQGRRKCYESDSFGGRESARLKQLVIFSCYNAGLLDSAAPIIVEGYHLATILCGQVLEKPLDPEIAVQRARSIGITDIEGYLKELEKIPIMSRYRMEKIARLMEVVTRTVSELAFQKYLLYRRSRRYLNKVINSVPDCIISTNPDSKISMINEAGSVMFGYEEKSLIGQSILSLFSDAASVQAYQKQMKMSLKESCRVELVAINADRNTFPAQVSLSSLDDDDPRNSGYVVVLRDISEEKKLERMKEDLIGMLTHDMGNPILSMQKAMQLMVDEVMGPIVPDQMEVLRLALGTSHQLLGIVTDFLDIYRSENGQFLLRKFVLDLNQILEQSIMQVNFFATDKNIRICFDPSAAQLEFMGDRNRLFRTCVNLLDNAIKYSSENSEIRICTDIISKNEEKTTAVVGPAVFKRLKKDRQYFMVSIMDQGTGIPKEHQENIFDKFFTIQSNVNHGRKGTGLGLTFCKLVVTAHKGSIWVKSPLDENIGDNNKGCGFYFILPKIDDKGTISDMQSINV